MRHVAMNAVSIEQTLNHWCQEPQTRGILALVPEAESSGLPLLQAACRQRSIPLCGGIFPALLTDHGFTTRGAWLFQLPQTAPRFLIPSLNSGEQTAAERIVAEIGTALKLLPPEAPRPTLFLIFDGMLPNIASILDSVYLQLSNRVEYAGVNAGSESFQAMPCLFDEADLAADGVLGILLPGTAATMLEHGFTQPEQAMTASSTDGNRIATIDWKPAFQAYQEVIKGEYGVDLNATNFYEYAVHFPFGILRANGEVVVRIPVALKEDGSLLCIGEVPKNAMLMLLHAPAAQANSCIQLLADKLRQENGSLAGMSLLTFYCAGRRMHFGHDAEQELSRLQQLTRSTGMAGALSLGEIGSTSRWGYPMFHNATVICRPWTTP